MTYNTNIEKAAMPMSPELYEFRKGMDFYRYTSYSEDIIFGANLYQAISINRSGFTINKDLKSVLMTVAVPVTDIFRDYIANYPLPLIELTLYRAFIDDLSDFRIIFKGRMRSVTVKDQAAQVSIESSSVLFKIKLPNIIHQSYCNHFVFDTGCGVNELSYEVSAMVSVSGYNLVSSAFSAYADGYFIGGVCKSGDDYRLITNHIGSTITLQVPFDSSVQNGSIVNAYPGCDGAPATCRTRFNNFANFLGMPYIPSKNPAIWGFQ